MRVERRSFLATSLVAPFAFKAAIAARFRAVLTTDLAVPHMDPDDFYDVACAVALGFHGVVLDAPTSASENALREVGARQLTPRDLRDADAVVVVGAGTAAAEQYQRGQRVVLFAGDAAEVPEVNELMDPDAYRFLRSRRDTVWVPCFDGGGFQGSDRASWTWTHDDLVIGGTPFEAWFRRYCGDVWGDRSLYCGAYLAFATRDEVAGAAARPFRHGFDLAAATRQLLTSSAARRSRVR